MLLSSLLFPFEVAQARLLPRRDDGRRLPSGAAGQETPRPRIVPNHPPSPGIDRGHRALAGHADPQGPSGLHSSDLVRRPELTSPYTVGLPAGRFIARRSPQFAAAATRRTENKPSGPFRPCEGELYGATTSTTSREKSALSLYVDRDWHEICPVFGQKVASAKLP